MKHWAPATESYFALFLVCAGVVPAFFYRNLMEHMSPLWMFAWLFAISGTRRATGAARCVAMASLAVLIIHAIVFVTHCLLAQT